MERIQVQINGLSTNDNNRDGDCYEQINLRHKGGYLQPILPRKVTETLSQEYDLIFVHRPGNTELWLGIRYTEGLSYVYSDINTIPAQINIEGIPERITSLNQIGNIVSVLTESTIYYFLYKENAYKWLGEMPDLPPLRFKSAGKTVIRLYFEDIYNKLPDPDDFEEYAQSMLSLAEEILTGGDTNETYERVEGQMGDMLTDARILRYGLRLYDGSVVKHSPPILLMPNDLILDSKKLGLRERSGKKEIYIEVGGYKVEMTGDVSTLSGWEDIVKSVDVFISPSLGILDTSKLNKSLSKTYERWKDYPNHYEENYYRIVSSISEEASKKAQNMASFFLKKSIPVSAGKKTYIFPAADDEAKTSEVEQQEEMPSESFSHHLEGAKIGYTYNQRLHLARTTTTFFNGFDPRFFLWEGGYNGLVKRSRTANEIVIEVELDYDGTTNSVFSSHSISSSDALKSWFSSAYLSYPDSRAKRLTVYERTNTGWNKVYSKDLKAHDFLNIAYNLNGLHAVQGSETSSPIPNIKQAPALLEKNKIKVSATNNPMLFANENTYSIGDGEILNLATNTMSVTDRNYGQYPLFVFTETGVWTLNVGGADVLYSHLSSPTHPEAPSNSVVGETPHGVLFCTGRGLCIINANGATVLSAALFNRPKVLNLNIPEEARSLIHNIVPMHLPDYLKEVSLIFYNPFENEAIISAPGRDIDYIYNFENGAFYQSTEKYDSQIQNVYPQLLLTRGRDVIDFSEQGDDYADVSLILLPLRLGTPDKKKLDRFILRGEIYNEEDMLALGMSSLDGLSFSAARGHIISPGGYKDLDCGLMGANKYKCYSYVFGGRLKGDSVIRYLEVNAGKEYNNEKLR